MNGRDDYRHHHAGSAVAIDAAIIPPFKLPSTNVLPDAVSDTLKRQVFLREDHGKRSHTAECDMAAPAPGNIPPARLAARRELLAAPGTACYRPYCRILQTDRHSKMAGGIQREKPSRLQQEGLDDDDP